LSHSEFVECMLILWHFTKLFSRTTPLITPPLARYLIHILPDNAPLDLNDASFPHSNLDSHHDDWSWLKAAQELGKMGVWPSTHIIPSSNNTVLSSLTPESEKVHNSILDELPSTYPSITNAPSILGGAYKRTSSGQGLLLSGFHDAAAITARSLAGAAALLSRKRTRKSSMLAKSQKGPIKEEGVEGTIPSLASNDTVMKDGKPAGVAREEIDKNLVNKLMFLQQQQQMMMRNLAIAAHQQQSKAQDSDTPARHRLLDQFRDQLIAQQTTLKAHAATISSGGTVPNLSMSNSLTNLMNIDKDASEKGLHLGGPGGMQQTMELRQRQLMHQQQQAQQQQQGQQQVQKSVDASNTSSLPASIEANSAMAKTTTTTATTAPQKKAGASQSFWNGSIMWTVALPNNSRNQAVCFVSAQCAPNTTQDTLMLPWPQKLTISAIQSISIPALQTYATKNSTSCILFQPSLPTQQMANGASLPSQQTNEAMYNMLAKMIDSKKSCAFLSLQGENCTPEAGILVVPTPTQTGNLRRLLGLVFKQSIPWHLLGGTSKNTAQSQPAAPLQQQQQPQQIQQQQQQQIQTQRLNLQMPQQLQAAASHFATNAGAPAQTQAAAMPSSVPTTTPQQALFQPQQQMSQINPLLASNLASNQQLPSWAQPVAAANTSFASPPPPAPPAISTSSADLLASSGIDFSALASQLNIYGQQQQQQQPAPTFNANMFNNDIWNTTSSNANNIAGAPLQQQQQQQGGAPRTTQPPPSVDLEALQRLLGLGST
jgi:hypothetical protein